MAPIYKHIHLVLCLLTITYGFPTTPPPPPDHPFATDEMPENAVAEVSGSGSGSGSDDVNSKFEVLAAFKQLMHKYKDKKANLTSTKSNLTHEVGEEGSGGSGDEALTTFLPESEPHNDPEVVADDFESLNGHGMNEKPDFSDGDHKRKRRSVNGKRMHKREVAAPDSPPPPTPPPPTKIPETTTPPAPPTTSTPRPTTSPPTTTPPPTTPPKTTPPPTTPPPTTAPPTTRRIHMDPHPDWHTPETPEPTPPPTTWLPHDEFHHLFPDHTTTHPPPPPTTPPPTTFRIHIDPNPDWHTPETPEPTPPPTTWLPDDDFHHLFPDHTTTHPPPPPTTPPPTTRRTTTIHIDPKIPDLGHEATGPPPTIPPTIVWPPHGAGWGKMIRDLTTTHPPPPPTPPPPTTLRTTTIHIDPENPDLGHEATGPPPTIPPTMRWPPNDADWGKIFRELTTTPPPPPPTTPPPTTLRTTTFHVDPINPDLGLEATRRDTPHPTAPPRPTLPPTPEPEPTSTPEEPTPTPPLPSDEPVYYDSYEDIHGHPQSSPEPETSTPPPPTSTPTPPPTHRPTTTGVISDHSFNYRQFRSVDNVEADDEKNYVAKLPKMRKRRSVGAEIPNTTPPTSTEIPPIDNYEDFDPESDNTYQENEENIKTLAPMPDNLTPADYKQQGNHNGGNGKQNGHKLAHFQKTTVAPETPVDNAQQMRKIAKLLAKFAKYAKNRLHPVGEDDDEDQDEQDDVLESNDASSNDTIMEQQDKMANGTVEELENELEDEANLNKTEGAPVMFDDDNQPQGEPEEADESSGMGDEGTETEGEGTESSLDMVSSGDTKVSAAVEGSGEVDKGFQ